MRDYKLFSYCVRNENVGINVQDLETFRTMNCIKVATCALDQWAMDFQGNLGRIKESIAVAKKEGARYRLGPELEISGYGCEDHFLEPDTFQHSVEVLAELLGCGIMEDIICDIGICLLHNTVAYNCRVLCLGNQILCIRPKMYLAGNGNYREPRHFARWKRQGVVEDYKLEPELREVTGQVTVPFGDCCIETVDTKVCPETCEELFTPNSPHISLGLGGVEIFTNGSGSHHNLRKLNQRIELMCSATAKSGGVYMYSNQMGCDGGRLLYDGCCLVAVNGKIVAQGSQFSLQDVEVTTAVIDLEEVRAYRLALNSRGVQASGVCPTAAIQVNFSLQDSSLFAHKVSIPVDVFYYQPEEEIAYGPACWLWDYLRRSGGNGFFLPLSGGADSSSTAAIVGCMCKMVVEEAARGNEVVLRDVQRITGEPDYCPTDAKELANRVFHTGYLGTSNSSEGTRSFARSLAEDIGSYHLDINIDPVVHAIVNLFVFVTGKTPQFRVHGGGSRENLALQNIQARFRMLFSYMLAQLLLWVRGRDGWLLVLGSANVDEALRGYLTKYDCSSADLNPIGGICKTDLKRFLLWASKENTLNYSVLKDIAAAPPTAELEPITGDYAQSDEQDMGMTYAELTMYGKLRKISRCGPVSMFKRLVHVWPGLNYQAIAEKVKFFFKMYSINRHKLTVLTPSVHMEEYSPEDNRHDLRQIFYNAGWPWQFRRLDQLVARLQTSVENK